MLGVNENSACTFHIRWNQLVTFKDQLKRPISPFLEASGFRNFFDRHL